MAYFFVSKIACKNGKHKIHDKNCSCVPDMDERYYLGNYSSVEGALAKGKTFYEKVCYQCCKTECSSYENCTHRLVAENLAV